MRTIGVRSNILVAIAAACGIVAALGRPWYGTPLPATGADMEDMFGGIGRALLEPEGTSGWDAIAYFDGSGTAFYGANDEDGGSYIYYENADGVFTKLIDSYSPLDGKNLSRIRMLSDTALGGELFFRADFTDGTSAIYSSVVAVPEPAAFGLCSLSALMMLARRSHCGRSCRRSRCAR